MNIEWKLLGIATFKIVGFFALVIGIATTLALATIYFSGVTLIICLFLLFLCYLIWIEYKTLLFKRGKVRYF